PTCLYAVFVHCSGAHRPLDSFPTRRSSDLGQPAGMGTQPRNNGTLCVYGGTEMTSQDELRDRIADVIYESFGNRDHPWVDFLSHPYDDGAFKAEGEFDPKVFAQAIIDELGLTMETNAAVEGPRHMRRIISEWEWE